jgi:hypothetical protein
MSPSRRTHGQSDWTPRKEGIIAGCEAWYMKRFRDRLRAQGRPYVHVDLHSGTGRNDLVNTKGSPQAFLDAAGRHHVRVHAFFVDKRRAHLLALYERLERQPNLPMMNTHVLQYMHGDSAKFLAEFPQPILETEWGDQWEASIGSMLCDPNGISHKRGGFPPLGMLARAIEMLPRWLLMIHWDYGAGARTHGYQLNWPERPMSTLCLEDILASCPWFAGHWLIAEPQKGRTVLCASRLGIKPWPKVGLHALESERGRELRRLCTGRTHRDEAGEA